MRKLLKNNHLELSYELIQRISAFNFEYIYNGLFTKSINSRMLNLFETNLTKSEHSTKIRKNIFFILVECLQNITRHQLKSDDLPKDNGIIVIQKVNGCYNIITGNLIKSHEIDILKGQIDYVNKLDLLELKEYYSKLLISGQISEKGGAGLGLIAMGRKSENKLVYGFDIINANFAYFYLQIKINSSDITPSEGNLSELRFIDQQNLEELIKLHRHLNIEKILLNFNGFFNQTNVNNIMPIIQEQTNAAEGVEEIVNKIMLEMLQNIVKYSVSKHKRHALQLEGNPGIFLLGKKNKSYLLTAGNYIENNKIDVLKRKIDFINHLNLEKLNDFKQWISAFFEEKEIQRPDLSLIEMKLQSLHNLQYNFYEIDDVHSFYTIQCRIDKRKANA